MTMTITEAIAAVEDVLAQLQSGVGVAPLAAGDLPPRVAAGELITSAWGNAVVDALPKVAVGAGRARVAPHVQSGIGTALQVVIGTTLTYATRMVATASLWAGSDSTALGGVTGAILTSATPPDNQPVTPPASTTGGGGMYAAVPLTWSWVVPAGQVPDYSVQVQWTTGGGTIYSAVDTNWVRYRS